MYTLEQDNAWQLACEHHERRRSSGMHHNAWDALRRMRFPMASHYRYVSWLGNRCVADWCTGTGTCDVKDR